MNGIISIQETSKISKWCSLLGHAIIQGDVEILKNIYGIVWRENPAIIEIISSLQNCITSSEIEADHSGIYNSEFLYYWGMMCLGEQSSLVYKNIETARNCFKKLLNTVPNVEARLAYIGLLCSDEPAKSEDNVKKIDTLRRWAGKQDLFSRIVLARIVFEQFLSETEEKNSESSCKDSDENKILELPIKVIQLLQLPCSLYHPVAVRFWNEIMDYIGTASALNMRIDTTYMNEGILYDYKSVQICK